MLCLECRKDKKTLPYKNQTQCSTCYLRYYKKNREKFKRNSRTKETCALCPSIVHSVGLCRKHYLKQYRDLNRDQLRTAYLRKRAENLDSIKQKAKDHYRKNSRKIITKNNRYAQKKMKLDINYKLAARLRSRLYSAIRDNQKCGSAVADLGCSVPELKSYLESKFQSGMNWDNWGIRGWHIDHIIPLSSFDLQNPEEFRKATHYTNLQPLWWYENFDKRAKMPEELAKQEFARQESSQQDQPKDPSEASTP